MFSDVILTCTVLIFIAEKHTIKLEVFAYDFFSKFCN